MGLGKNLVYRAFKKIRLTCLGDKPEDFSGIVEVDETYLGGQWKNKRKSVKRKLASKGGIRKQYLNLYLAEYVWRCNHRGLDFDQQIERLLKLINEN